MNLKIDKKNGLLLLVIGILAAALIFTFARSNEPKASNQSHGASHGTDKDMSTASGSDITFFQMMIPHHQQAIEISDLALTTSENPKILELASEIKLGQSAEIKIMNGWIKDANSGSHMGHQMDEMDGMLSNDELTELAALTGDDFDIYWLTKMIAHHEGAIQMVTMIEDSSVREFNQLGADIKVVQSDEITRMKSILKELGA